MTAKKALKIGSYVLLYTLLTISTLSVLFILCAQRSETGAMQVFGYQLLTVESSSMEECQETDTSAYDIKSIPTHSLVFVKAVPKSQSERNEWYSSLKVGDVLSFRYQYAEQVTITHRITNITENGIGGYFIELKGDNSENSSSVQMINTSLDATSANYIIGKVTGQSRFLGLLLHSIRTPLGLAFIVMIPCAVIIVGEILRIISVFSKNGRAKLLEEQKLKDAEIEDLKRKISQLEEEKTNSSNE